MGKKNLVYITIYLVCRLSAVKYHNQCTTISAVYFSIVILVYLGIVESK